MAAHRFTLWRAPQFLDSPPANALADGLRSLEKVYTLKKVPASATSEVCTFTHEGKTFYFKQYHCRSLWDFIKHAVRPSRAQRAMQAAAMLKENGFAAPEVVAMGCRRKGIFRLENFLLTREVENALPLYIFFEKYYGHLNTTDERHGRMNTEKRKFITALGHLIGRLHAKNISHGDIRLGNILVRFSPNRQPATSNRQPAFDFFFLDNERTVQCARLPDRLRLKNLVQCNMYLSPALTRTDSLRFFTAYLAENPALAPAAKMWLKKINRKTVRRLADRLLRHTHPQP